MFLYGKMDCHYKEILLILMGVYYKDIHKSTERYVQNENDKSKTADFSKNKNYTPLLVSITKRSDGNGA
jgi:hypothetical protein